MSAGLAVIKTIMEDGLLDRAASSGEYFLERLAGIKEAHPGLVKEVRGKGLILGVEFKSPDIAKDVVTRAVGKGLLTILTEQRVMRLLPPLTAGKKEIDQAIDIISETLDEAGNA